MNLQDLTEALAIIADEQQGAESVELRIGGEEYRAIELHLIECGSRIVDSLLDHGFAAEVTKFNGVRVTKPKPESSI